MRRFVLESTINCDCFLIALRFGTSVSSSPLSSSSTISRNHLNGHDHRIHTSPVYPVLLLCKGIGNDNLYTLLEIMNMMQEKKYAQRHTVALIITFQFFMEFFQYYRQWMCTD